MYRVVSENCLELGPMIDCDAMESSASTNFVSIIAYARITPPGRANLYCCSGLSSGPNIGGLEGLTFVGLWSYY